ncbi:Protein turtle [Gryllus bimaculatus]|nr:Protein turtle [Gryllus bimaculatus]
MGRRHKQARTGARIPKISPPRYCGPNPPIVDISSNVDFDNVTVNETTDISLYCSYEANPTALESVKWYRDGQKLELSPDHYVGNEKDTALLIKNSTRYDQGAYTCVLENSVGSGESKNAIYVAVYYKPQVKLLMDPPSPVRELDALNITLTCKVESGNPDTLLAVRWYLGGDILKELPECDNASNSVDSTFCDIDPSKLLLEDVVRAFHGNYSCEGKNEAGWGPLSAEEELVVHYPPGPATLVYAPTQVVKKSHVTLSCSVEDPGRPATSTFRWTRGSHHIHDMTSGNWTIDPVTLETQSNFTCLAYNEGGEGEPASVAINVSAPPTFISRLLPYYGALLTSKYINISCQVECSPVCSIQWLKNGVLLETGDGTPYNVIDEYRPPNFRKNDFESIRSTLVWNMSAWEGSQLDRVHDNANYTCQSSGNEVGPGVRSNTFFGVEYPPENISVSHRVVNVVENNIPGKVRCVAKGYPNATYHWQRVGQSQEPAIKGDILHLNYPLSRHKSGNYTCVASNKHGSIAQNITINVQYKPECGISQSESDGKLVLTCTATANPPEVDFVWHIKGENESIEENVLKKGYQSQLILESYVENFRTYICVANNSIGTSIQCERDVTGHVISWWKNFENDNYKIIIAVIVGAILMVIIVCISIIVVCRRKRADDKYNNPVELEERENPDGDSNLSPAQTQPRPVHKWPLRPGVLVHVNGAHSLNLGRCEPAVPSSSQNVTQNHTTNTISGNRGRAKLTARKAKQRRAASLISEGTDDTNQHSRANKIRQMFINDSSKYRCETMPGVFHGKSGVVTFKKLDGPANSGVSRKRKKPGSGPSPSATKDKSKQDLATSPSDGLLQPDGDKAFYENLPFHGMQSAPNKPVPTGPIAQAASRPSSQLSQYGSSGYGSTRSHMGPHLQRSQTLALVAKDKFNSLRIHPHKKHYPQFYSMRLHHRNRNRVGAGNNKKQHDRQQEKVSVQLSTISSQVDEIEDKKDKSVNINSATVELNNNDKKPPDRTQLPIPAPRKQIPNKSVVHTYQNVPIPIASKSQELTMTQSQLQRQQQQHHHHHYNLTSQHHLLMNPTNTTQFGSTRRSHSSRNYLPPMRLEYQQPYYMTDPYVSDSVVYADLALATSGGRREPHLPSHYRPQQTPTEYAILKFHDVGQEIDV